MTVWSLVQKTVAGDPALASRPGKDGYADWMVLATQGIKEYLGHDYRKWMGVRREMPRMTRSLGLTATTLPHFSTVCARKQGVPMKRWRTVLDSSAKLYGFGDVQEIDIIDADRILASQYYAKRTVYTFEAVHRGTTML